jgi:lipopolysaccharide/colanic/teichoic acid biosynthesis glycosyltransferase
MKCLNQVLRWRRDIAVSVVLLLTIVHFLSLTVTGIRWTSEGLARSRKKRVRRERRVSTSLGFWTVIQDPPDVCNADDRTNNAKNNPPVAKIDGVLRRMGCDELPQLLDLSARR